MPPIIWGEFDVQDTITADLQGIKRLASALIIRAILDSRGELSGTISKEKKKKPREITRSAIEWLLKSDSLIPPSFLWCCSALYINPIALRLRLKTLPNTEGVKRFFYSQGGIRIFDQPDQLGGAIYRLLKDIKR